MIMAKTQTSRIFTSGDAATLFVTIPASVATDSQFPFQADDEVVVNIADDSLVITPASGDVEDVT